MGGDNSKELEAAASKLKEVKISEKETTEVQRTLLNEPWRNFEKDKGWTPDYEEELRKEIKDHKPRGLKKPKIVLFGPIKAGKSSFINSVESIEKGRMAQGQMAGDSDQSMTLKLKQYVSKTGKNFRLLDTMGIEDHLAKGFNIQDVIYIIEGNLKTTYEFKDCSANKEDTTHFRKVPTLEDKTHCVVIVMDCGVIDCDGISEKSKVKIKLLQKHIQTLDVPTVMLLTKIDEVCDEIYQDIKTTFKSRKLDSIVKKAHEIFGVPIKQIFPIKNYSSEQELDTSMNILILLALRRMMHLANDRLESMADQRESDEEKK